MDASPDLQPHHLVWRERVMVAATWILLFGPPLFFSAPGFRRIGLMVLGVVCLATWWPKIRSLSRGWPRGFGIVLTGLAIAHGASLVGGWADGADGSRLLLEMAKGVAGVGTILMLAVFWLDSRYCVMGRRALAWLLGGLLLGTLGGYFCSIERWMPIGGYPQYFDPLRIALIWPTRVLTMWRGELLWEHTNIAGFFFAFGSVVLVHWLTRKPASTWLWLMTAGCMAVVVMTGSRSAWLMVICALPFALAGAQWPMIRRVALLLMLSITCGFGGVFLKGNLMEMNDERIAKSGHTSGLVTRGSAGRLAGYALLWEELEGRRVFGRGLDATNKPLDHLMHEHSIYMASLRGGGLVALAAHLAILAAALWRSWLLFRRGIRWPAVVLVAVMSGLLFDRVSIFKLTGHHEFVFHWAAVLIPFALSRQHSERKVTDAPCG
jgi:hypothetical protein